MYQQQKIIELVYPALCTLLHISPVLTTGCVATVATLEPWGHQVLLCQLCYVIVLN